MTSTNYPIDLKLPKWWDVMGLKIDEIMGYNGLATKKLIIHKLLEVFCLSTLRVFDSFLGGKDHKHQTEKLFDRFLFSTLQKCQIIYEDDFKQQIFWKSFVCQRSESF